MRLISRVVAATLVASAAALAVGQGYAATFAAWEVANLPFGDTLTVRKYPSNGSQKQGAYPNGTVLQMTGRCTGGLNLKNIANLSDNKQRQLARYKWCEVWHDPKHSGEFVTGWVYGRYIIPH